MHDLIFFKASRDFFEQKFLFLSLAPFIVPIIILSALFIYGGGEFVSLLQEGAASGDFSFLDENTHPILAYILGFSVAQWLLIGLFAIFGTFGVILFSLVLAILTVGLLTPIIVKSVRTKHYQDIKQAPAHSFLVSLGNIGKIFAKFILLFLVTLPFLFIPVLNIVFFQLPFFYLFYQLMMYDMISVGICEHSLAIIKESRLYLLILMGLFFFVSLIPLFGLLLQVFFVIYLSHFILSKSQKKIKL